RAGTISTSWPRRSRPVAATRSPRAPCAWRPRWPAAPKDDDRRPERARPTRCPEDPQMSEPTVVTLADPAACALAAAERIVEILDVAIEHRGHGHPGAP